MPRPKGSHNKVTTEKNQEDEPIFIEVFQRIEGEEFSEN